MCVVTYLRKPVVATIIQAVGSFQLNEQVNINRVTEKGAMFGLAVPEVPPTAELLSPECVDSMSRAMIMDEYRSITNAKRP